MSLQGTSYNLDPEKGALNFDVLSRWIVEKDIQSVEALLAGFSEEERFRSFLRQFVLMHSSRSHERDDVSPLHPRVILHADLLFLAYTDRFSGSKHHDQVVLFEFDPDLLDFLPRQISFAKKGREIITEPQGCDSCHGSPPRPLWHDYPTWPGAYGSHEDLLEDDQIPEDAQNLMKAEKDNLFSFLKSNGKKGRYAHLEFPQPLTTRKTTNKALPGPFRERKVNQTYLNPMPGFQLTAHLYHLNFHRIINQACKTSSATSPEGANAKLSEQEIAQVHSNTRAYYADLKKRHIHPDFLGETDENLSISTFDSLHESFGAQVLTWPLARVAENPELQSFEFASGGTSTIAHNLFDKLEEMGCFPE